MSELIASLDKDALNPIQYGENNHIEYSWNIHIQERIIQLYFQLVRTSDYSTLENKYQELLNIIFNNKEKYNDELTLLYRMIANVRDVENGKGEYELSYMLLYNFAKYDMKRASQLLKHFFMETKELTKPYGSWKDVKYFSNFCKKRDETFSINLYEYLIALTNIQLIRDNTLYEENLKNSQFHNLSLCAKWIPRENKSFGWMYENLALDYYERSKGLTADKLSSKNYAKMYYRNILTKLNKYLDTVQIKMCKKTWSLINFNHITSITLEKQKYAITFKEKNGKERNIYEDNYKDKEDRLLCAKKFSNWQKEKSVINGKNVSMYDFVKSAIQLSFHPDELLIDVLNKQWVSNGIRCYKNMEYMIPMVDTSKSMTIDNNIPLYNALGLGIRIAEKSKLGKRCLTFSEKPTWINLEEKNTFYDCVSCLRNSNWGMNTNFQAAMDLILEHIKNVKMEASEVEKLCIVVLSDMQFDDSYNNKLNEPIDKEIIEKFKNVGLKICNKPYKTPKIIFWNLRNTNGFPSVSFQPGVGMISGYSPQLMNAFIEKGEKSLHEYNPYNILKDILNTPRYSFLK